MEKLLQATLLPLGQAGGGGGSGWGSRGVVAGRGDFEKGGLWEGLLCAGSSWQHSL